MKATVLIFAIVCVMFIGFAAAFIIWAELCSTRINAMQKRIEVLEWQLRERSRR